MKNNLRSVCVFCGSKSGKRKEYLEAARAISAVLVENNVRVIYGGGSSGMMGEVADTTLALQGAAVGVIPEFMIEKELGHNGLTEQHVVRTMHERKEKLISLCDGYIILPGGVGTMDELFEVLAFVHLGIDKKPVGILNTLHLYDPIVEFLHKGVQEEFIPQRVLDQVFVSENADELLRQMMEYANAAN